MNNPIGKQADRSEEIAFQVMEGVLGVEIFLADADGRSGSVDGRWQDHRGVGVVEVTGPPAQEEMRRFAVAQRDGTLWRESGNVDAHLGSLAEHLSRELEQPWATENIAKLNRVDADERHLYLIGRTIPVQDYFARLSDEYASGPMERIGDLTLPDGISDVWFAGRGARGESLLAPTKQWVARFNRTAGWTTGQVEIDEQTLPAPKIGPDPTPPGWRLPQRDRRAR